MIIQAGIHHRYSFVLKRESAIGGIRRLRILNNTKGTRTAECPLVFDMRSTSSEVAVVSVIGDEDLFALSVFDISAGSCGSNYCSTHRISFVARTTI